MRCSMENSAICGERGRVFTEGNARRVECRLILTFDRNMTWRSPGKRSYPAIGTPCHRFHQPPPRPLFATIRFIHAISVLNWIDRRV